MKNLLTYKLFESEILDEALTENRWPSDWKKMPEWKELEKLGFYDASTPIQSKNKTIMLKNKDQRFDVMYPEGIVLQQSGYVRDKGVTSGYIKSYNKDEFTLKDMFNYLIDRYSNKLSKASEMIQKYPDLSEDLIYFINKITNNPWKYNSQTNEIDVDGKVSISADLINHKENKDLLYSMKFGKVKGDFAVSYAQLEDLSFLPNEIGGDLFLGGNKMKNLKEVPKKIKGGLYLIDCYDLESLEGLNLDGSIRRITTSYFSINNVTPGGFIEKLEKNDFRLDAEALSKRLIKTIMTPENFAPYFKNNPLKIHLLDFDPKLKKDVLKITGMRDLSNLSRSIDFI
jgi:hypothetical protein